MGWSMWASRPPHRIQLLCLRRAGERQRAKPQLLFPAARAQAPSVLKLRKHSSFWAPVGGRFWGEAIDRTLCRYKEFVKDRKGLRNRDFAINPQSTIERGDAAPIPS